MLPTGFEMKSEVFGNIFTQYSKLIKLCLNNAGYSI